MKKSFLIGLLVIVSSISFAQKSINSYKYIIVPNQFEFQKFKDSYQLNSLTKFLFEREGFIAFFENDQFPNDLASNRCLALLVGLQNSSSMFTTKILLELKDCNNTVVFSSQEAKSKSKDYKTAYQEVLRKAFEDVEKLDYSYSSSSETVGLAQSKVKVTEKTEVVVFEKEIDKEVVLKEEKEENISKSTVKVVEKEEVTTSVDQIEKRDFKSIVYSLEGNYLIDNWGKSTISKNEDEYSVVGGDESFEFATIYKTSKPNTYIIKWAAFKQPQLLELNSNGSLSIDTVNGISVYNRLNN